MVAGAAILWLASLERVGWSAFGLLALVFALPPFMLWSPHVPLALSMVLVPVLLLQERLKRERVRADIGGETLC